MFTNKIKDILQKQIHMLHDSDCCICLQPLIESGMEDAYTSNHVGDDVGALRCGHVLHYSCASQHLEHRKMCPMCRAPLNADEGPVLIHLQLTKPQSVTPTFSSSQTVCSSKDNYLVTLLRIYTDVKQKAEVLKDRKEAMTANELQLSVDVSQLQKSIDAATRTEGALKGKWRKELTAKAEAEELMLLQQCAIDTRRAVIRDREALASVLRESNDVLGKIDKVRDRLEELKSVDKKRRLDVA